MNLTDIQKLAQLVNRRGIAFLEFEENGACLSLASVSNNAEPIQAASDATHPVSVSTVKVLSPSMGILRLKHPQRDSQVIAEGQQVVAGDIVGWLEYGGVLTEISAVQSGVVSSVKVADGDVVGFAQLIIELE